MRDVADDAGPILAIDLANSQLEPRLPHAPDYELHALMQKLTRDRRIFTGLAEGTYKVRLLDGRGWRQTSPTNDRPLSVTIKTGEHSVANNFFVRHGRGHQKHRGR